MPESIAPAPPRELRAIILAAGGRPLILEKLGERSILELVIDNARELVPDDSIYLVVGKDSAPIRNGHHCVCQETPLGTGDAVLQAAAALADFQGDLLILYGDTPLQRAGSLRGLLNRHRLKQADLTLLTAVLDRPLPYGRIVRDAGGRILDIIEETEASPEMRGIHELNVGAYLVDAQAVFAALRGLAPSPADGHIRLTDSVHQMLRAGLRVESYRLYDDDEVQGINSSGDLATAEFIVQKRLFRPRKQEDEETVAFGTGGWRAVIGEGFTMRNVRRLSQALANDITRRAEEARGVVIGYDRRFLSRQAAEASAEVFAGNNVPVVLLREDAPTPLITFATAKLNSAFGLVFTASHNPPEWNGLKVFHGDGSLLLDHETRGIEAETNRLTPDEVIRVELDIAVESGVVEWGDFTNSYVDAVETLIDLEAIRNADLKVIVDPMYGVGQLTLGIVLTEARCRVTFINDRHNPLFGGRSPAPNQDALRLLSSTMGECAYDLGLAMDGDADRIAILDERGEYISVNELLLLLYWYMHEVRGERGGVVRNIATSHLLDRMARHLGEECYEVPVGFKHIAAALVEHNAVLGGESSGGLTIRGHILGKDGIFASALVVEMLAKTGKRIGELRETVFGITGRLYGLEEAFPATPEMRVAVPRRLTESSLAQIGAHPVAKVSRLDGIKVYLKDGDWALVRFSGTEPVVRVVVEADSPEKAEEIMQGLKSIVGVK
jgi:phosphomannomutase